MLGGNTVTQRTFEIDGNNFNDFAGFIVEFNRCFVCYVGGHWQGNIDAFNDYLSWTDERCTIRWLNSSKSSIDLGHESMATWLRKNLETCHPSNVKSGRERLENAMTGRGPTLFEWIVDIIRENGDNVDFLLD